MWENILKSTICVLVLFIALSGENANAQDVKYLDADNLTRYDQLGGLYLYYLYGDKAGNVWISSSDGLIKFDGYDFEYFFHNPNDSKSIGSNHVTSSIIEDQAGDLWIGSVNMIFKYTPGTNSFTSYDLRDIYDDENPGAIVPFDNLVDDFGNIFFATYNISGFPSPQTLLYFDAKDQKIKKLASQNGYELKNVFKLAMGPDHNVWALNHDGLFRIDENKVFHKVTGLPNYFINNHENGGKEVVPNRLYTDIKNDSKGVIWLTTNQAELYSFDPKTQKLELHLLPPTFAYDIPHLIRNAYALYWSMYFDKKGNLYIGSHKGVLRYNPTTNTSWVFAEDKAPNQRIYSIHEDVFGNIWLCGRDGIFYKYNPSSLFKTLPLGRISIDGPTDWNQYDFFAHKDSSVLMYSSHSSYHAINQLDFSKGEMLEYSFDSLFPGLSNVHILGALEQEKYLINSDQGLAVFENGVIRSSSSLFDSLPAVTQRWKMVKDSRQNLWWCSDQGLYLQWKDEQQLRHFDLTSFPNTNASSNRIKTIYESKNGNIWIITYYGLFHYDYEKDKIERYLYDKENGEVVFSQDINTLYEDDDRVLWIGARQGGLSKYNLITKELKTYTQDDGLSSMQIIGILADENSGELWLSTQKGIAKFNSKEETFVNFSQKDGLKDMSFGQGSCFKTADGYFVFGAFANITYFRPEDISAWSIAPKVYLADFKISDQSIRNMPALAPGFVESTVQDLSLNYRQNSLSFEYKAIHYDNPEANQYAYKLEHYDQEWRTVGNNRKAFYNNLPAGEYAFLLKAANSYGVWSEPKVFASFTISPPWWATWWAYSMYFLAGMALIYSIYRFQLKRNLHQAEAGRLKELDAVKNRLYTNITHEFRTPLTVISGMTDQMEENPKDWFREGLSMIRRNTNRLLELVNQILDLTKLESGKMSLHNQQGDIITYLKYLVESIHSFAESKKIQVHFHEEGGSLIMDFDPEKVQQIMTNLLSNAVKFTPAEGHIHVLVRAVAEKESPEKGSLLQIKVKNTGAGIPEDQLPYVFDRFYQVDDSTTRVGEGSGIGLALVKELVKLMKGDISVRSKVGKETEFTVLLPISNVAPEGQTPAPTFQYEAAGLAGVNDANISTSSEKEASETMLAVTKPMVLLVEDNPDVVAYTASCLQGQYNIQVGKDGQEGLDIALENIPDLIITDVMMPVKDGFEVCHTLKTDDRTSHIPIIMLTAKADMESKITGLEQGADAYLAKPFHKKELLARIKNLLELRENLQKHYLSIAGSNAPENSTVDTPQAPAKENQFVLKLREVVEAHLEDFDFTVEQFCHEVAMSHSQLLRKITALTGLTPNQFIRHIRLHKAKLLLQDPETSIHEVAYSTGFKDPAYFSRVFKKEFGVTPQEWK